MSGCDLRATAEEERFDLRDFSRVREAVLRCDGVIHLGAVSRIVWGERNPALCRSVNIGGMKILAKAILESPNRPWLLFASSREVYGSPARFPCGLESPMNPENVYAETKVESEKIVADLRAAGNAAAVLRLSNVFGATDDHADRVAPAFARAAAFNKILRVEGADNFYDFNSLDDTVDAMEKTVGVLSEGENFLPPLDIVTGRATSLRRLAEIALEAGGGEMMIAPPRGIGAEKFQGDPRPAESALGWRARRSVEESMAELVHAFRKTSHD